MTKILALDTATEACSAALLTDDNETITRFELAPRNHTKLILPMMEEVLKKGGIELKELDAIAFSRGPGAFTGLRIAAGVAQGVALSIDKPVVPVSTLAALALSTVDNKSSSQAKPIMAALDARMGEVYWGVFEYKTGTLIAVTDEFVTKPEALKVELEKKLASQSEDAKIAVIGSGWDAYQDQLLGKKKSERVQFIKDAFPSAEYIAELAVPIFSRGEAVSAEQAQPVYIRNKVAEKSKKKPA